MRATDFEFRHRFWFILLVFALAFSCYTFHNADVAVDLLRRVFPLDHDLESAQARHWLRTWFALSATLVAAAALVRSWGTAYLRAEVVHDSVVRTERLVADGPFRYVRNPLYFGNLLLSVGIGMFATNVGFFVLVIGQTLIVLRLIGREEAGLVESQGDAYCAYQAAVPRLFPAITPRVPAGNAQPHWLQGFLGEIWMWLLALDGFLFAWTLNIDLYFKIFWICAGALFLRGIVMRLRRRRTTQTQ